MNGAGRVGAQRGCVIALARRRDGLVGIQIVVRFVPWRRNFRRGRRIASAHWPTRAGGLSGACRYTWLAELSVTRLVRIESLRGNDVDLALQKIFDVDEQFFLVGRNQ